MTIEEATKQVESEGGNGQFAVVITFVQLREHDPQPVGFYRVRDIQIIHFGLAIVHEQKAVVHPKLQTISYLAKLAKERLQVESFM